MGAPLAGRLPERAFAGVLFDMDGTLIDSLGAVERSWLRWCEELDVDPAALAGSHGRTSANTIALGPTSRPPPAPNSPIPLLRTRRVGHQRGKWRVAHTDGDDDVAESGSRR